MSQHDQSLDPFGPWRSLRDASLDAWAKALTEAVNSDAFAQAMGAYLDTYVATSAPFQKALDQSMSVVLPRMSLPMRDEVLDLAQRMTHIELRLDDLDARTDQLMQALRIQSSTSATAHDGPAMEPWLQAIDDKMTRILLRLDLVSAASQPVAPATLDQPSAPAAEAPRKSRRRTAKSS